MARYEHTGNANYNATLNADITSGSGSLTLNTGGGTGFPTGGVGKFWIVIDPGTSLEEHILATDRSGDSITGLTRGQDNTSAVAHSATAKVYHFFPAFEADEANAHINTTTRDDHTQYVHNTTARTISAGHTFSGAVTFTNSSLQITGGGTLAGTFTSSSATLAGSWAGSPSFSGTPVFNGGAAFGTSTVSGSFTMSGTPVFSAGANLGTGTYSGSATFSGVLTFSSATGIRTGTTVTTANAKAGVIAISDIPSALGGNPANGGFLYSNSGALTWRGPSGTVTVLAPA